MDNLEQKLAAVLAESQEPPADLFNRIVLAIERRQRVYARLKFSGFSLLSAVSIFLTVFAFGELARQLGQNGSLQFFSLIFSDLGIILANWQDFSLSVLESLPVFPITLSLAGALMFLVAIKFMLASLPKISRRLLV